MFLSTGKTPDSFEENNSAMYPNRRHLWCQLGVAIALAISGAIASSFERVIAQLIPDSTLGSESSVVTPQAPGSGVDVIQGGATRGPNLFHSFEQFSVLTGREAFFNNALDIQNIISRVTGAPISNIDGLIRAKGTANLFLLNPNGIIFGPNASLAIGGSFVGSTASSVNFTDGSIFSATAPQTTPLLTISVPVGLQFGETRGSIAQFRATNSSGGELQVPQGKTLALVGGNVGLDGGALRAPGGRVEVGGVAEPATVGLNVDSNNLSLSFSEGVRLSDVSVNRAVVNVSAISSGSIAVTARNINILGESALRANRQPGSGAVNTQAGDITLNATEATAIANNSLIENLVLPRAVGDGGNINITTGSLSIRDAAKILANTNGTGNAGNVNIRARDEISLAGGSRRELSSQVASRLQKEGVGNGGNINITSTTGSVSVTNGAEISASLGGRGNAGNITITASDTISFNGVSSDDRFPSGVSTLVQSDAVGNAGNIDIKARSVSVTNGAVLTSSTLGLGDAGSLTITASDTVSFDGFGSGFDGPGSIGPSSANSRARLNAQGNAGEVKIIARSVSVTNNARLAVSNETPGDAGQLTIAADELLLDNRGSLQAFITSSGEGGNIDLQVRDLILMRRQGLISAAAGSTGNGGNITIGNATNTPLVVAFPTEDSDIIAQASKGRGGDIDIFTQGIFGLEVRNPTTPQTSDIDASSEVGIDGTVEINRLDIDPSQGLVALPTELVDASNQIAAGCAAGSESLARNEFTVTGRGGLPPSPSEALRSDPVQVDLGAPIQSAENSASTAIFANLTRVSVPDQIVEAQGWAIAADGEVILTANAPSVTPHIPIVTPAFCNGS